MELQPIPYRAGEGDFTGLLADGSSGRPAPGVLVAHESLGLTRHIRERTQRLAELGFVAFAIDLFGEHEPPIEKAFDYSRALAADLPALRARMRAALAVLQQHPHVDPARLAAVGFCFGGAAAVELARDRAPLAAVVGFHAGVFPGTEADDRAIRARILLCHGADDEAVATPRIHALTEAFSAAGVDWQLNLYGGVTHSFTNPDSNGWDMAGFAYDEKADRRSWAAMRTLLDEAFGR